MHDLERTVLEFMAESGFIAYISRPSGEYDPAESRFVETTKVTPVKAILLDLTLQSNGLGNKLGTEIMAGDKQLYVQPPQGSTGPMPLQLDPTKDTVKIGATVYKIVTVKEINTTGTYPILYDLYIRR